MKVILNNKKLDNIPVLEYYQENSEHKGLIFVQHGYQSTKEYGSDYLAVTLARMGYFVVAIDAYKHGERIQEPYLTGTEQERMNEAYVVVKRTALDIIRIHHNFYQRRFPKFDMIGVSLGGMVAYYLATKTNKVRKLVPVISTPDFHAQVEFALHNAGLTVEEYMTPDKTAFIDEMNPLHRLDKLQYEELHIFCGNQDDVVPMKPSQVFYETYKNDKMFLKVYDTDHNVPRNMQMDIFACIEQ